MHALMKVGGRPRAYRVTTEGIARLYQSPRLLYSCCFSLSRSRTHKREETGDAAPLRGSLTLLHCQALHEKHGNRPCRCRQARVILLHV